MVCLYYIWVIFKVLQKVLHSGLNDEFPPVEPTIHCHKYHHNATEALTSSHIYLCILPAVLGLSQELNPQLLYSKSIQRLSVLFIQCWTHVFVLFKTRNCQKHSNPPNSDWDPLWLLGQLNASVHESNKCTFKNRSSAWLVARADATDKNLHSVDKNIKTKLTSVLFLVLFMCLLTFSISVQAHAALMTVTHSHLGSCRCCLTISAPWWRSHLILSPLSNTLKKTPKGLCPTRATCRISTPSSSTRWGVTAYSCRVDCFISLNNKYFTYTLGATRDSVALPGMSAPLFPMDTWLVWYSDLRVSALKPIVNKGQQLWHFVGLKDGERVEMHLRKRKAGLSTEKNLGFWGRDSNCVNKSLQAKKSNYVY